MAERLSVERGGGAARADRHARHPARHRASRRPCWRRWASATDWEDLRVYGALLLVGTELFNHPNVHYLSGFFGPIERALRDAGANISFAPADFRRFAPLLEEQAPAGDGDRRRAARRRRLVQPLAARRRHRRRDEARGRGPRPRC